METTRTTHDAIGTLQPITIQTCASFDEYVAWTASDATEMARIAAIEASLVTGDATFDLPGYCAACGCESRFLVDFQYAPPSVDGKRLPNWRERLECSCGLNNRMRAAVHFLCADLGARPTDVVYATERITPLYGALERRFPLLFGSEYLRDGTKPGASNQQRVRHEDATALTFPDASLDVIASFDVIEHVVDFGAALAEFRRCLRPNGRVLLSAPFFPHLPRTITRARIGRSGEVEHLEPPEYHGDPLNKQGVLCFYHFGWDLLDELRAEGFADPLVHFYWSLKFGYLGGRQFLITARCT